MTSARLDLDRIAATALRRLAEPSTVLGLAPQGVTAVIARRAASGEIRVIARIPADAARAFAAKGWIAPRPGGRTALRFGLSPLGRRVLAGIIAGRDASRPAPRRPLADRLAAIRTPGGRLALWPEEIALASAIRDCVARPDADLTSAEVVAAVAGARDDRVARCFEAAVLADLPFAYVARREGMTLAGCRAAVASAVRALAESGVRP